jgi:hypothetical protein
MLTADIDVGIGRSNIAMPEQFLERNDVRPMLEHMCRNHLRAAFMACQRFLLRIVRHDLQ